MNSLVLTALYVPGDRPDRFDKAVASGADMVILDLEDAVAPENKVAARAAVAEWLTRRAAALEGPELQVRVNAPATDDLVALAALATPFDVRATKVQTPSDVDAIVELAPGRSVAALLETALGIENALAIAQHPAVTRLAIGESDLASQLGSRSPSVIEYARNRVLFASHAAGLAAPMMAAYPAIRDLDGLRADTARGSENGWLGRTAIHPSQLSIIREAFASTPAELAWAHEVLAALSTGGVSTLANGEMVDPAMRGRAESILRRAARASK